VKSGALSRVRYPRHRMLSIGEVCLVQRPLLQLPSLDSDIQDQSPAALSTPFTRTLDAGLYPLFPSVFSMAAD